MLEKLIQILIYFLILVVVKTQLSIIIQSSNPIISQTTDHYLTIYKSQEQTITNGSYIKLTYGVQWTLNSVAGTNLTNDYCQSSCILSALTINRVANTIKVNNMFPNTITKHFTNAYTLKNILNPSTLGNYTITIDILTSLNVIILSASTTINVYSSSMVCSGLPATTTISQSSIYTFTLSPSVVLPNDGYIIMVFPNQWNTSATALNITNLNCLSLAGGSMNCSAISALSYRLNGVLGFNTSSPFQFKMGNFSNPGSEESVNQLLMTYYSSTNIELAKCYTNISSFRSTGLLGVSFSVTKVSNGQGQGVVSFTTNQRALITDEVRIQLDSTFDITPLIKAFILVGNQTTPDQVETKLNISSNIISILAFQSSQQPLNFTISLSTIKLPQSFEPTLNISIGIYRNNYLVSSASCCNYTLNTSEVNNLSASISLSDNQVGHTSDYYFTIMFPVPIFTKLLLLFSSYSLTVGSCTIIINDQLQYPACVISNSTTIQISGLVVYSYTAFKFTIRNILNPSVNSTTVQIRTVNSNNFIIRNTQVPIVFSITLISFASVTTTNKIVGALANYTFLINNTNSLVIGSKVHIICPPQISFSANASSFINGIITTSNITNTSYIIINLPSSYASEALFLSQITITNVNNPKSTATSDSFTIQLQSASSIIQQTSYSISVTMDTLASLSNLTIIPSNNITEASASYNISFILPFSIIGISNVSLRITLPPSYTLNLCSSCSNYLQIPINQNTTFVLVENITNPSTVTNTDSIIVVIRIKQYNSASASYILTTWAPKQQLFTLSSNNTFYGENTIVTLSLTNLSFYTSILQINIPPSYGIILINTLISDSAGNGTIKNISGYQIRISNINLTTNNITLEISGITNPTTSPSISWNVTTYNSGNIKISESSSNVSFVVSCTFPCRQCLMSNTSFCLSCYSIFPLNTSKYLSNGSCVNLCNSSQYTNLLNCYSCDPSCLTCSISSNNCTSCISSKVIYSNECVSNCPQTYFNSSGSCVACSTPCYSCNLSGCVSCVSGKVLSGVNCLSGCPVGFYNYSNVCISCESNCSQCDSTGCSVCINSTLLFSNQCVVACPKSYYISTNGLICQACISTCLTCSIKSNNCTSCDSNSSNKYFLANNCLTGCPNGTFPDGNFECQNCISPCSFCNSPTNCTKCLVGLLYNQTQQCLSSCPLNSINVGVECLQCQSPCLKCSLSITNCTQCIESYFLDGNSCNATCSLPYFAVARQCRKCYTPCLTCINSQPYACITCLTGYFILSQSCYTTCPKGTFQSGTQCSLCGSGCYQCVNTSTTCVSCIPGLYLFGTSCLSKCPTILTVVYYEYQTQCIPCQSQCTSCLSSPIQCTSCSSLIYKFNTLTRQCTINCSSPFFTNGTFCKPCQLPCKTCIINFDKCQSCYNGKFLYLQQCISVCPDRFFASTNNTCTACQSMCLACTQSKCLTCDFNTYLYQGLCFLTCPSQAPYVYKSYCRNCLKDYCLFCSTTDNCTMCQAGYFGHLGACVQNCPDSYEKDNVSGTRCVLMKQKALSFYLTYKQKLKAYPFLGTVIFIGLIPILFTYRSLPLMGLNAILSIPQTISFVFFIGFLFEYSELIPFYAPIILLIIYLVMSWIHTILAMSLFLNDKKFNQWISYGSNYYRTYLIIALSFINKRLIYILFSGLNWLPFTTYRLTSLNLLKPLTNISLLAVLFFQIPTIALGLLVVVVEGAYVDNYKLLFCSIDVMVINFISVVVTVWQIMKRNRFPDPYCKYIIEGVSKKAQWNYSENAQQIQEQDDDFKLVRTNSQKNIVNNKEMEDIQFRSVFDPSDYEDPPRVHLNEIQGGIKKGVFRKKKRKNKNFFHQELDVISQQSEEEEIKGKGKKKQKKKKVGFLNNYMYWKPPQDKKIQPQKVFQIHERQIMDRIRQKQSQFDTITRNDFIFQEQEDQQSHSSSNSDIQYGSRRELNPKQNNKDYDNIFNLNYAAKRHLR